jgi:hypothetical protein
MNDVSTHHNGGAKGTRTPDLLVANETRYQLRHSPADRVGRSASRLYHRQAEADFGVSSPAAGLGAGDVDDGASAVTGPSWRSEEATPGPDKSMVRTVRGASGLET